MQGTARATRRPSARIARGDLEAEAGLKEALRHEWGGLWFIMGLSALNIALAVWRPRFSAPRRPRRRLATQAWAAMTRSRTSTRLAQTNEGPLATRWSRSAMPDADRDAPGAPSGADVLQPVTDHPDEARIDLEALRDEDDPGRVSA